MWNYCYPGPDACDWWVEAPGGGVPPLPVCFPLSVTTGPLLPLYAACVRIEEATNRDVNDHFSHCETCNTSSKYSLSMCRIILCCSGAMDRCRSDPPAMFKKHACKACEICLNAKAFPYWPRRCIPNLMVNILQQMLDDKRLSARAQSAWLHTFVQQ